MQTRIRHASGPNSPGRSLSLALLALLLLSLPASAGLVLRATEATIKTTGNPESADSNEPFWNLSSNGELGDYVRFPADGNYRLVVRAKGSPAKGGWPLMAVMIDGRTREVRSVPSPTFADYTFTLQMTRGVSRVTLDFLNDLAVPSPTNPKVWIEDRNLYLSRLEVHSPPGAADAVVGGFDEWSAAAIKREDTMLAKADKLIETNRKADAVVNVVDASGKAVPAAKVTAELVRHDFRFGCNIYMFDRFKTAQENDRYKQCFADLFNYATVGFYWRSYEPKKGQPDYAYTDKVVQWCQEHGIKMKGHPLLWGNEAGVPVWSKGQPDANVQKQRVTDIMHRYSGRITSWEVVNEPSHELAVQIADPYRWARQGDPNATLIVNDYQILADGWEPFFDLLKAAIADGTPFDGIGIQAHEPRTMRFPLDRVWEILDHYASLGKSLHITEFTPTSSGEPITGSGVTGKWDEAAQSLYAQQFYRVCFAHPAVTAITWWDLCDAGSWLPGGGMLRKDLSPKPVYTDLMKLLHGQWQTHAAGSCDEAGRYSFRGFLGSYRVTVQHGGKSVAKDFYLTRQAPGGSPPVWTVEAP